LIALLFANGNFIKPVPPCYDENGKRPEGTILVVLLKLAGLLILTLVFLFQKPVEVLALIFLYFAYIYLQWAPFITDFFIGKRKTTKR